MSKELDMIFDHISNGKSIKETHYSPTTNNIKVYERIESMYKAA
jgi:hypothetical protein